MWCAVNRKTRAGVQLGPEERLTPMEAIRCYTVNAAYASFEENLKGSIEEGKLADLVVLSEISASRRDRVKPKPGTPSMHLLAEEIRWSM